MLVVSLATQSDVEAIAPIHQEAFPRQTDSYAWLAATVSAAPKNYCFTAKVDDSSVGYVIWAQKSGIRPEAVVELEQIAISKAYQGKGYGVTLIKQSLSTLKTYLSANNQSIKSILVSTREDNSARKLYESVLGAKVEATLANLYSANEVLMVAKNVT